MTPQPTVHPLAPRMTAERFRRVCARITMPRLKRLSRVLIGGLVLALIIGLFVDGPISNWAHNAFSQSIGGDLKRAIETYQQFGDLISLVLVGILIWQLDPKRRHTLFDLGFAYAVVGIVGHALKLLVGRARPKFDDPSVFLGPLAEYPTHSGDGFRIVNSFTGGADFASMPSSHTTAAVTLAVFVALTYPKLRGLAIVLAVVVGMGRVLTGAHYPSDVIVGAALAFVLARLLIADDRSEGESATKADL